MKKITTKYIPFRDEKIKDSFNYKILEPILKEKVLNHDEIEYIPGYIDDKSNFYNCPIIIDYIKIKKYSVLEHIEREGFSIKVKTYSVYLDIYSKDFKQHISRTIRATGSNFIVEDIDILNNSINFLNKFINSDRTIEAINFDIFNSRFPKKVNKEIMLNEINNLNINVYSDSKNIPGKDNKYWTEAIIDNLPKNKYLKTLFVECIKKQGFTYLNKNNGIVLILESESAWSPTIPREHLKNYPIHKIKDTLIMDMALNFNPIEYTLSQMEK